MLASGLVLVLPAATAASAAPMSARILGNGSVRLGGSARTARGSRQESGPRVQCVASTHAYDKLATRMAHDIDSRLRGRISTVGLEMTDSQTGITCQYHAATQFYAASAIKVTILASLLRKAQEEHRALTASEKNLAWLMITESDNDAAQDLWLDVGMPAIQHFLNLAKMHQTQLNDAWGLCLLTAHDETLLLKVISTDNKILDRASRVYERDLMAHVIAGQRWGVPAGAPRDVTVHVKNGWLNYPTDSDWVINSLGIFTATTGHRVYDMAVLTHNNPDEGYGIDTIEGAARVMHRDLSEAKGSAKRTAADETWGIARQLDPD